MILDISNHGKHLQDSIRSADIRTMIMAMGFHHLMTQILLALGPLRHHWIIKLQEEALIIEVPFSSVTLTLGMPNDSTLLVCFVSFAI